MGTEQMGDVITGRVKTKCATLAQWQPVWQTFVPMKGELVVISDGIEGSLPGIKVGDGVTSLYSLQYVSDIRFEDLDTVAWTGSYNDLNNKPDADDISYDWSAHHGYTQADNVGDALGALDSDIYNLYHSGFITGNEVPSHETDPTVPGWAKAASKPSYTATEVGALPNTTVIPSATSDLLNDSGYITSADVPTDVSELVNDVPYAAANSAGAALSTTAIPYGNVDDTSTSTVYTATVPGITELKTGVIMMLHNGVVTSASGFTININNLGAKPVYSNMTNATRDTTIFNANYTMLFIYDATLDSGDGGWWCYRGYNSDNNTIGYIIRTNSSSLPMDSVTYRYRILFSNMSGDKWIPANNSTSTNATATRTVNQTPIDPFGRIVYYGTTASVAAGNRPSAAYLFEQQTLSLGYSFNRTGAALNLTLWEPVWLKTAPQADGSVIIDSTTPYVQTLPTTEDGKVYILLGIAYSATNIELTLQHPVKWYHDGAIRNWTGTGNVVETSVSDVAISSGSWKKLAELSLTAGTWLLVGNPRWANGSPNSGTRQMCFSTTAAQNTTHGKSVIVLSGNDTNFIGQTSSYIMRLSADSTVYLNVQHTQGGTLNCSAEFQAVKM